MTLNNSVRVEINNSGEPKNAQAQVQPDINGKGLVVSIVLDDFDRNGPIAQALKNRS